MRGLPENARREAKGVSLFIPVFNEERIMEANLDRLTGFMEGLGRPFEIIVGSNGSFDRTEALGQELAARDERIIFFHLNAKGPGAAFREGLGRAAFDLILTQDMDLSVDLSFIPRALDLLAEHDLVIGSKKMGTQRRSWVRITGSGVFILCARALLGLDYQDYSLAAKGFRKGLVLENLGWVGPSTDYVLNLTYRAQLGGRSIIEIPVFCRDERESRFNLAREGISRFARLGQLWAYHKLDWNPPWPGEL